MGRVLEREPLIGCVCQQLEERSLSGRRREKFMIEELERFLAFPPAVDVSFLLPLGDQAFRRQRGELLGGACASVPRNFIMLGTTPASTAVSS